MAKRSYAPMAFLRSIPVGLLQAFFLKQEITPDINWQSQQKKPDYKRIHEAILALPRDKAIEVEGIFYDVYEIAHEAGIKTLIEEGRHHEIDLETPLAKMQGFEEQALWVYVNHQSQFEVGGRFNHADLLGNKSWRTRGGFPATQPRIDPEATVELAARISEHFKKESRGKNCVVENWWRAKKVQYFFAYPEDYARIDDAFDAKGRFHPVVHKPVFEVIFRHDPETGVLGVYANGAKPLIEKLQTIFCDVMWGIPLPPVPPKGHPYELNEILKRNFRFETSPVDHIDRVGIRMFRLSLSRNPEDTRHVILQVPSESDPDDMPAMYKDLLNHENLKNEIVNVTQATFEFEFKPCELTKDKRKIICCTVTFPDRVAIASHQEAFRPLIEKYLQKWKIYRVESPAIPVAANRSKK